MSNQPTPTATAQSTNAKRRSPRPGLDFTPVRNGMDYLSKAVDDLTEGSTPPSDRDLKYAVLHLQAATEVLLKARLVGEHWSLVLKDPGSANLDKFKKGDFESCGIDATMNRLRDIAQVEISLADSVAVSNLAGDRNALTHYGHTVDSYLVEARAARVLSFLIVFIEDHLRPMLDAKYQEALRAEGGEGFIDAPISVNRILESPAIESAAREADEVADTMDELRLKLSRVEKLVDTRMKEISGELAPVKHCTVLCPDCRQWALVLNDDGSFNPIKCRFCLIAFDDVERAAIGYFWHVIGEDNGTVAECSSCRADTIVIGANVASDKHADVGVCFNCNAIYTEKSK